MKKLGINIFFYIPHPQPLSEKERGVGGLFPSYLERVRVRRTVTIFSFFLICFFETSYFSCDAQKIARSVVSSTGNYSFAGGIKLSSTVGEPITTTLFTSNSILTQGFQQPSVKALGNLQLVVTVKNASCIGAHNGSAYVTVSNGTAPFTYLWSPGNITTDTAKFLASGEYSILVTDANGFTGIDSGFVSTDADIVCDVYIYSGFTPNGDGHNDTWKIDYIEALQPNKVAIFNRWGEELWTGTNYDNSTVVWKGTNQNGVNLPDATYYYVVEIPEKIYKGWVEIMRE